MNPEPAKSTNWLAAYALGMVVADRDDQSSVHALVIASQGRPEVLDAARHAIVRLSVSDWRTREKAADLLEDARQTVTAVTNPASAVKRKAVVP